MTKPSRIVDAHQHVFWHNRDDRGLIQDMDAHGIETAWLLTWEVAPWENYPGFATIFNPTNVQLDGSFNGIPFRDLLTAHHRYPGRFVLGYCPHPAIGEAPNLLRAAVQMHGVRVCGEWKFMMPFDDPRCLELFKVAGELKLPVVLHLDIPYRKNEEGVPTYRNPWYGGTVENLERALQACPETNFIGHAPGFWREISGGSDDDPSPYPSGPVLPGGRLSRLFDAYPNLYADLSANSGRLALARDPEHAVRFLTSFQDRIVFGRDYYGQDLHETLQTLNLPPEITDKLYFANAEKLLAQV